MPTTIDDNIGVEGRFEGLYDNEYSQPIGVFPIYKYWPLGFLMAGVLRREGIAWR